MTRSSSGSHTGDPVRQPIINTPYQHPDRYWRLDPRTQRATDELLAGRRPSGDYLPVPQPMGGDNLGLQVENAALVPPHTLINRIRACVDDWRSQGWKGASHATSELLEHWKGAEVDPRPFFCQVEAMETLVWLHEAGRHHSREEFEDIRKELRDVNASHNEGIPRMAMKMATGTGKTRLMQMIICWLAANHRRGVDVLAIAPSLTVKDRLQELKPQLHPEAYAGLLPRHLRERVNRVRVTVLNFHAFRKRDKLTVAGEDDQLSGSGKKLLRRGQEKKPEHWEESDEEMLGRLLRHPKGRKIVVLNDEAHHCYLPSQTRAPDSEERDYEKSAAVWFNALRSLKRTARIDKVLDLSATPMYLRKPAELSSEIFPWTVTDYPLIEAVEAGLTKIPRVPTDDDSDRAEPVYRNLYENTPPRKLTLNNIPTTVTSLLEQMHEHYRDVVDPAYAGAGIKPVMIVVANSVENATALFGHISGYYDGANGVWVRGAYESFSNVLPDGSGPKQEPPTLLVHSALDSDDDEFPKPLKKVLKQQAAVHTRDIETQKDRRQAIRDIFNTIGLAGRSGQHIRCVVSVSMLTEGWDARTVTHIFGFRRFGTQLLCEQVAGRGLRRTSFESSDSAGMLQPEMVNIFGVPFSFMRAEGEELPLSPIEPYQVYSIPERAPERRISFPNIVSYRLEDPGTEIRLDSGLVRPYEIAPSAVPSMTEVVGTLGDSHITELTEKRKRHVLYKLASLLLGFIKLENARRRSLFGCALRAVEDWIALQRVSGSDLRLLLVEPHVNAVPEEIAKCCLAVPERELQIRPVFADEWDPSQFACLDTGGIYFETTKKLFHDTERSELNRAPCDSQPEVLLAKELDTLGGIAAWARNFRLGWRIPYMDTSNGVWRNYVPDFVARLEKSGGKGEPIHLVIEYKGQPGPDSDMKTKGINNWWLPAVNGSDSPCCAGEWRYVFIDSEEKIRPTLVDEINS